MDEDALAALYRSLTNITPDESQLERIAEIREAGRTLAEAIISQGGSASRERSLAVTKLEECVMWAVKGVLING